MSSYRAHRIALVLACTLLPGMAAAQVVMPGAHVRLVDASSNSPLMVGTLVRQVGDSVTISTAANLASSETQTSWVVGGQRRLEVRTAVHDKSVFGAVTGALAGAALGVAIGASSPNNCGQSWAMCVPPSTMITFGGALAGSIVGALIGHGIKSETWRQVDRPPVRLGVAPSRQGALFTASFSF